jgi:hypothetical protein
MRDALNLSAMAAALGMCCAAPALAQDDVVGKANPDIRNGAQGYWTPERFRAARPFPIPRADPGMASEVPAPPRGLPVGSAARPPACRPVLPELQVFARLHCSQQISTGGS